MQRILHSPKTFRNREFELKSEVSFSTWNNNKTETNETRNILWPFLISPETQPLSIVKGIESPHWNLWNTSHAKVHMRVVWIVLQTKKYWIRKRRSLRTKENKERLKSNMSRSQIYRRLKITHSSFVYQANKRFLVENLVNQKSLKFRFVMPLFGVIFVWLFLAESFRTRFTDDPISFETFQNEKIAKKLKIKTLFVTQFSAGYSKFSMSSLERLKLHIQFYHINTTLIATMSMNSQESSFLT